MAEFRECIVNNDGSPGKVLDFPADMNPAGLRAQIKAKFAALSPDFLLLYTRDDSPIEVSDDDQLERARCFLSPDPAPGGNRKAAKFTVKARGVSLLLVCTTHTVSQPRPAPQCNLVVRVPVRCAPYLVVR